MAHLQLRTFFELTLFEIHITDPKAMKRKKSSRPLPLEIRVTEHKKPSCVVANNTLEGGMKNEVWIISPPLCTHTHTPAAPPPPQGDPYGSSLVFISSNVLGQLLGLASAWISQPNSNDGQKTILDWGARKRPEVANCGRITPLPPSETALETGTP